jgi:uncharacterized damage-inducible protein DinB
MRQDPDRTADERDALSQFLDFQRETILIKAEGLSGDQLAQRIPTSNLTLAGILYHLALVEESWMEVGFLGLRYREDWAGIDLDDPDSEFRIAPAMDPEYLRKRYREACERSRAAAAQAESLDQLSASGGQEQARRPFSLRWILLHLIEETARHAGHADLLREAIDSTVGE